MPSKELVGLAMRSEALERSLCTDSPCRGLGWAASEILGPHSGRSELRLGRATLDMNWTGQRGSKLQLDL